MKTDISHIPLKYRNELDRVVRGIFAAFNGKGKARDLSEPVSTAIRGKSDIVKIILFGSFARGGWVDDKRMGPYYQGDFDILVAVRDKTSHSTPKGFRAEDIILEDDVVERTVEIIVERIGDLNDYIRKGHYFFTDIREEGVLLYDSEKHREIRLAEKGPISLADRYELATEYFEENYTRAKDFIDYFSFGLGKNKYKSAAFMLHQATEHAYHAYLLVHTLYTPKTHSLRKLRKRVLPLAPDLEEVWHPDRKPYRRYFDLLHRAYVEGRYSAKYKITKAELEWLQVRVRLLHERIERKCLTRLAGYKKEAEGR